MLGAGQVTAITATLWTPVADLSQGINVINAKWKIFRKNANIGSARWQKLFCAVFTEVGVESRGRSRRKWHFWSSGAAGPELPAPLLLWYSIPACCTTTYPAPILIRRVETQIYTREVALAGHVSLVRCSANLVVDYYLTSNQGKP